MGGILCISVVFNWVKVKLVHRTLCEGEVSPISPCRALLERNSNNVGMSWEWRYGGRGEAACGVCLFLVFGGGLSFVSQSFPVNFSSSLICFSFSLERNGGGNSAFLVRFQLACFPQGARSRWRSVLLGAP